MEAKRTSLTADLRRGDATQVLLKLQRDGVMPDDYAAIATNDAMRAEVVAAILRHRMFTPPEEQIKRLLEINEAVWKDPAITKVTIRALGEPPACPISDENGLYCVCLFFETGDVARTFERNWQACVHVHGQDGTWKWDGLLFAPEGVKQREGAMPRQPGLRWQVAELGRKFKGQPVSNVRPQLGQTMGMGQEGPLAAALHRNWAVSMNGDGIPYMDMPDLDVAPDAKGEFSSAPCLDFNRDDRRVKLNASRVDNPLSDYGSGSLR